MESGGEKREHSQITQKKKSGDVLGCWYPTATAVNFQYAEETLILSCVPVNFTIARKAEPEREQREGSRSLLLLRSITHMLLNTSQVDIKPSYYTEAVVTVSTPSSPGDLCLVQYWALLFGSMSLLTP